MSDDLATATWSKGGYAFMVIGGRRPAAIKAIADALETRT